MKKKLVALLTLCVCLSTSLVGLTACQKACEHQNTSWKVKTQATCESVGFEQLVCEDCQVVIDEKVVEKKGHSESSWKIEKGTTCVDCGFKYKQCTKCDELLDVEAVTGHEYANGKCVLCGDVAHKHSYTCEVASEEYFASQATCTRKAEYYYSCSCGLKGEDTFAYGNTLGHDYGEWVSNGDDTHTKTCSRDESHKVTEKCYGGFATDTSKAICDACDAEYGTVDLAVKAFKDALAKFDGLEINDDLLAREYWNDVNALAEAARDVNLNEQIDEMLVARYNAIIHGVYKAPMDAISKIRSLAPVVNGEELLYSQYIEILADEAVTYSVIEEKENAVAYVAHMTNGVREEFISAIEAKKQAIKERIDNAITAIGAIDYYNAGWVANGNDFAASAEQQIVLDSEISINLAKDAILAIYNGELPESEKVFVENLDAYNSAVDALAAQKARAQEVVEKIDALSDAVTFDDLLYTLEYYAYESDDNVDDVEDGWITYVEKAYAALADQTEGHNDLQGLVADKYSVLAGIRANYELICSEIATVIVKNSNVPSVENIRLIEEHKQLIIDAEDAYKALPKDVKDITQEIIDNYDCVLDARARYDELETRVENLKQNMEKFVKAYATGELIQVDGSFKYDAVKFFRAFIRNDYLVVGENELTADQRPLVEEYIIDGKTWLEHFNEFDPLVDAAYDSARIVIAQINSIGNVVLTAECGDKIKTARQGVDALEETNSVAYNYVANENLSVLVAAENDYKTLEDAVKIWASAVIAIEVKYVELDQDKQYAIYTGLTKLILDYESFDEEQKDYVVLDGDEEKTIENLYDELFEMAELALKSSNALKKAMIDMLDSQDALEEKADEMELLYSVYNAFDSYQQLYVKDTIYKDDVKVIDAFMVEYAKLG